MGVPTLAGAVFFRSNREKAESINGMCGLSEKHGKSEILYAAPVEPCGWNGWRVQGNGMIFPNVIGTTPKVTACYFDNDSLYCQRR